MESLRMDYRFTALLIVMLTLLALFGGPAHSRNDYLNNGSNECRYGEMSASISKNDYESESNYRHFTPSNSNDNFNENSSYNASVTFRKYLGVSKKDCDRKNAISLQNEKLKQQLELYKKCGSINRNSTLQYNENFNELVVYCKGVGASEDSRPTNNLWKSLKNDYIKENPNKKIYGPENE